MMADVLPIWAARIRAERKSRAWPADEMARRLRDAADAQTRARLPNLDVLVRYVRRWETGAVGVTERYRLLYARAFGIAADELFQVAGEDCSGAFLVVVRPGGALLTPDDEERLMHAAKAPSRLDLRAVDSLETILAEQRRLEDHIGSTPLVEMVRAQLAWLEPLVTDARGSARPQVLDVAAQWAQFAGWLHANTGHADRSLHCLARALEWATEIGDTSMVGSVMSWKGYLAEQAGQVGPMIGLSQAAQRGRTPVGRAYDLYQEARGHALAGDSDKVDRLLEKAGSLANEIRPEHARPWEYYYLAPGFFSMEHGLTYRILGRSDPRRSSDAIRFLTAGLRDLPDDVRSSDWAGDFVCQLAFAYAQVGAPDAAAAQARQAAAIARGTASGTLIAQVQRLHARLTETWPTHPAVAELGDVLR